MAIEGLKEYRELFALSSVEEFVDAALTFNCPIKPTAFCLEQVSLLLGTAEERLLLCNAETHDAELEFSDEEDDATDEQVDAEAAALLQKVRKQQERFAIFRKMDGMELLWSYVRDLDEETLGRVLVSNQRLAALEAFGVVPQQVLDCIPLYEHVETWKQFTQKLRETKDPHRWFLNRMKVLMRMGLFQQAAEWAAFGCEICDSAKPTSASVTMRVLTKLVWEYTTYCLQLWNGAFSLGGDPGPLAFSEFCALSQTDRLRLALTNVTKETIVDSVKDWLSHSIDVKEMYDICGLPEDSLGDMDEILVDALHRIVTECDRSSQVTTFSTVAAVAIASKPTFSPAERVIRSPFLLTKFILRIVYEVECRAMHIIDDVDEMYLCIPGPEAHRAVGASQDEWKCLMEKANALNDHLVTVVDVLKPYGYSQALSFQELASQITATMSRNLFQNLFRTLGACYRVPDDWFQAIEKITYIHQRTFHLMPQRELFELYTQVLVDQNHFDVLERVLSSWQTVESLQILVAHARELTNSSPALKHALLDKAKQVLLAAAEKGMLPEIEEELRFLRACEILNQLEDCRKPGSKLQTATDFIRNVALDGVEGATGVVGGIVGGASKIKNTGVVEGLRSFAGGLFASDGAIAHLKDGIKGKVKNVVHTFRLDDTAMGPPPFSNPLQLRLQWQTSAAVHANIVEQLLQYNIAVLDHQQLLHEFLSLLPPCDAPSKDISCLLCSAFLLEGRLQDAMVFIDELLASGHPTAWRFCVSYAWREDADSDTANELLAQALKSCSAEALPEVLACLPQPEDDEISADILEGPSRQYTFDPNVPYPSNLRRLIERDEMVAHALAGRFQHGGATSSRASGPTRNMGSAAPMTLAEKIASPIRQKSDGSMSEISDFTFESEKDESPPARQAAATVRSAGSRSNVFNQPVAAKAKTVSSQWSNFSLDIDGHDTTSRGSHISGPRAQPSRGSQFSVDMPVAAVRPRSLFLEETPIAIVDMPMDEAFVFVQRNLPEWIGSDEMLADELIQILDTTTDARKCLLVREVLCHLAEKGDFLDIPTLGDWTATRALRRALIECPSLNISGTTIDEEAFFRSCEREALHAVCQALIGANLGTLNASFLAKRGLMQNPSDIALRTWLTIDDMRELLEEAQGPAYFTFARWWRNKPELADVIQRKREGVLLQYSSQTS